MKCKICGSNEVVYSGIDAFCLGVPTESVCYSCANTYAQVKAINEAYLEKVKG